MTSPTGLELVWAETGGTTDPGNNKYQQGWVAEIPTFQNFNHVLQSLDKAKLSYAEKDIYPWQDFIAYEAGARVKAGNKVYICLSSHNDSAGANPQDPELDTTNSYWAHNIIVSSKADAYSNINPKQGLTIDQAAGVAATTTNWESNAQTIKDNLPALALNIEDNNYDNWLVANVRGELVVVNTGNDENPDSQDLRPANNGNSYKIYHEGNKPTQSEISGTIPANPEDGTLYGRRDGNWVRATSIVSQTAPPPPVEGNGSGWYNLDDGTFYIDIDDGDSSQWVPASPPVSLDILPETHRLGGINHTTLTELPERTDSNSFGIQFEDGGVVLPSNKTIYSKVSGSFQSVIIDMLVAFTPSGAVGTVRKTTWHYDGTTLTPIDSINTLPAQVVANIVINGNNLELQTDYTGGLGSGYSMSVLLNYCTAGR